MVELRDREKREIVDIGFAAADSAVASLAVKVRTLPRNHQSLATAVALAIIEAKARALRQSGAIDAAGMSSADLEEKIAQLASDYAKSVVS